MYSLKLPETNAKMFLFITTPYSYVNPLNIYHNINYTKPDKNNGALSVY